MSQQYTKIEFDQGQQRPPMPSSYLVWAILVTLFCCLPFGIAAIVYASRVDGYYNAGNYAAAQQSSDQAKKWCLWGLFSAVAIIVLYFIFVAVCVWLGVKYGEYTPY